jgi:hypothetical protein
MSTEANKRLVQRIFDEAVSRGDLDVIDASAFGDPHAAWGVSREEKPPEASSAILKIMRVIQAIDTWSAEFEKRHVYSSPHEPLIPKVNIEAIQAGAPFRPNYYPGVCSIYVDRRRSDASANPAVAGKR